MSSFSMAVPSSVSVKPITQTIKENVDKRNKEKN